MQRYELTFISRGELSQEQIEKICTKMLGSLTEAGGSLVDRYDWGLRTLAYPIKKQTKGFYTTFLFDGPQNIVRHLEEKMRLDESILRFLSVAAPGVESISVKEDNDGDTTQ